MMNTSVKPVTKKTLSISASIFLSRLLTLPPVTTERQPGKSGNVQGEKKEIKPPANAPIRPIEERDSKGYRFLR